MTGGIRSTVGTDLHGRGHFSDPARVFAPMPRLPQSPVFDARRQSLGSNYSTWTQQVKVETVKPDNITVTTSHLTLAPNLRPTCRCTVSVLHNGHVVYTQWWIAGYADPSAP